ncbi:MAG: ATP-binding protein [Cyanobacteria bacterium J06592_8]
MSQSLLCHFIIGPPAAGKSTFAHQLATLTQNKIVSTDAIRRQLYGDETVQGSWAEIEVEVCCQMQNYLTLRQPFIYDATNAKRAWRMDLLMKLSQQFTSEIQWIAWHLKTPLEVCLHRNQQRQRQVSEQVIKQFYQFLKDFPPVMAEGFVQVVSLEDSEFDPNFVKKTINSLSRNLINRQNRTQNSTVRFHSYSHLLDFDRLLHLVSLFIHYPGLGNLQQTHPQQLQEILGTVPVFEDQIAEIAAVMERIYGKIYADQEALAKDLNWLQTNGLIGEAGLPELSLIEKEIQVQEDFHFSGITHFYSDLQPFKRLITAIRLILHRPFLQKQTGGSLITLQNALAEQPGMRGDCYHKFRKDIENVLKPFKIIPEFPLRAGYFAGTGILSTLELKQVFAILQSQANSIQDPITLEIYETFKNRMASSRLLIEKPYPTRAIAHRSMIDEQLLHDSTLYCQIKQVEEAIANCELLEVIRSKGRGKFPGDKEGSLKIWPLQIAFYHSAWYLGYEQAAGTEAGLLRFERLDRLASLTLQRQSRSLKIQETALQRLHRLLDASVGMFLGNEVSIQRQFLGSKTERKAVEVKVELGFDDKIYPFICEGTKRFAKGKLKMSPPLFGSLTASKQLFSLNKRKDPQFPNQLQVILPCWSLNDVDLQRWIVGFGGSVKVIKP